MFSYDIASGDDRDFVRLTISDTDQFTHIFEDEELDAWLARTGNVLLASASALETMASNEALVSKRIKILDLTTDGPAVAKALQDAAKRLRELAVIGADAEPAFAIAEQVFNEFGAREWLARSYGYLP